MQKKNEYLPVKKCKFCEEGEFDLDYKDAKSLQRFTSGYFKIEPRKRSGVCMKHQRKIATAVKRARILALIPFTPR